MVGGKSQQIVKTSDGFSRSTSKSNANPKKRVIEWMRRRQLFVNDVDYLKKTSII
jgi:hypothetical protein